MAWLKRSLDKKISKKPTDHDDWGLHFSIYKNLKNSDQAIDNIIGHLKPFQQNRSIQFRPLHDCLWYIFAPKISNNK